MLPRLATTMSATAAVQDIRLRAVAGALEATKPELLTFDVFDTLVFRRTDKPVDAFALVGQRLREDGLLRPSMSPAMFGAVRREAEAISRKRRKAVDGSTETDLHAIYDCFPAWPLAEGVRAEDLVAEEVDVERGLLVPDLDVVAFLEGVKDSGLPIAAVSDIYFREATLRELLQLPRLGPLLQDIEIHVSSELGFGKGSGLWKRTREVLGVAPERIVHFGDNPVDDVKKARKAGVTACYFPQRSEQLAKIAEQEIQLRATIGRPQALECRNITAPSGLHAMRGKIVGANSQPSAVEPFWRYGATVLGPVLSGFAQWVAREAAHAGVGRVACLMREGTLLAELIGAAGAVEGVEMYASPTWLNRQVGLAATLGTSKKSLKRLLDGRSGLTVTEALKLLGLTIGDAPALAGQAQTRLQDPTTRAALLQVLAEDETLQEKAAAHARVLGGRVVELLERAADASGALWIVDLGWGASIQGDAETILRSHGSDLPVTGSYLITNHAALERVAQGSDVRSFLVDAGSNKDAINLVMRSPEIIEQVTSDVVGTQIGLDEQLRPVNAQLDPATAPQRRQAEAVRQGVRDFHRLWLKYRGVVPGALPSLADAQFELLPILLRSITSPTVEEARLFGGWRHDEGRGSAREDPLAGSDQEWLLTHAAIDQLQALPMQQLYWPAGLVAQFAPEQAPLAQAAAAGLVPWDALSAPAGEALLSVVDGAVEKAPPIHARPLRSNAQGNVLLSWQTEGADLHSLAIRFARDPHVLRLDHLELRLWEQGSELPRVVRLAASDLRLQVRINGYVTVAHNVFAARQPGAALEVDLLSLRQHVVYRVEVLGAFSLMPTPAPLGGVIPFESDLVQQMSTSASWRYTRPLRTAARVARKFK